MMTYYSHLSYVVHVDTIASLNKIITWNPMQHMPLMTSCGNLEIGIEYPKLHNGPLPPIYYSQIIKCFTIARGNKGDLSANLEVFP